MRLRHAALILILVTATALAQTAGTVRPPASAGGVLTVNVHGDDVVYDQDRGTLAVHGHATVAAATDRPGAPTVSLAAEGLQGNLLTGTLSATAGVKLLSQQFALRGESVDLNFKADEFTLDQGAASVDIPLSGTPGRFLRGFFFGDKIGRSRAILYVLKGRVTTCDRVHPHYSIGTRKLTYNTATRTMTVYGGVVQLYGLRLRLPWRYAFRIGGGLGNQMWSPGIPGYSSYDGLFTEINQSLSKPESPWQVNALVRAGTKWRLSAALTAQRDTLGGSFTGEVSRRQQMVWNLRDRSRLDRVPELTYVRHLQSNASGLPRLELTTFAGHLRETTDGLPAVEASRAGVQLDYTPFPAQQQKRRGWWWGVAARQTFYSTGEQLGDLALQTGLGCDLGREVGVSVSGTHQFSGGTSPFKFDRAWIKDELETTLNTNLSRPWSLQTTQWWDLDHGGLRDYKVQLNRRMHCLTWNAGYNFGGQTLLLGVDLNGLTGGTPPPHAAPLVSPQEVPPLLPMVPATNPKASPLEFLK